MMARFVLPVAALMGRMTDGARRTPSPEEIRLRAELRDVRAHLATLEDVRLALQSANEGAYRDAYDRRWNTNETDHRGNHS